MFQKSTKPSFTFTYELKYFVSLNIISVVQHYLLLSFLLFFECLLVCLLLYSPLSPVLFKKTFSLFLFFGRFVFRPVNCKHWLKCRPRYFKIFYSFIYIYIYYILQYLIVYYPISRERG